MIATGSIGAAVQGLGACSTSGDELTELLAGITGTEVVSAGQLGKWPQLTRQHFPLSFQQRVLWTTPNLVSTPGFKCPTFAASVVFYLLPWSGEEQVLRVGRKALPLGTLSLPSSMQEWGWGVRCQMSGPLTPSCHILLPVSEN